MRFVVSSLFRSYKLYKLLDYDSSCSLQTVSNGNSKRVNVRPRREQIITQAGSQHLKTPVYLHGCALPTLIYI